MHGFPPSADRQVHAGSVQPMGVPPCAWARAIRRDRERSGRCARVADRPPRYRRHPDRGRRSPAAFVRWISLRHCDTSTDGIVVARGGRIVFERYANDMAETRPHILMSVGDRGRYPGRRGVL